MQPDAPSHGFQACPAPALEAAFEQIASARMRDLPFLNPRLRVAAHGFRAWQSSWIGVLITPWGINLMQLPTPQAPFATARVDDVIEVALPGAVVPFMPMYVDAFGPLRMCSLFSPAQQFADQDAAVAAAQETLRLLFETTQTQAERTESPKKPESSKPKNAPDPARRRLFGLRA